MWLDFDHRGFTAVDHINGVMRRDWRLDMQAPFALQSARQNDDQLLVTEGAEGRAGVELRQPRLNLTTVARKESGSGAMPATGWDGRFDRVTGTLNLPPGHRLIAAIGTDGAPYSWWERWGLWNVFGVLLIVGFVYWTAGLVPAAIAALALVLTYQEMPELHLAVGQPARGARHRARRARRALPEICARLSHGEFRGARHRAAAVPVDAGPLRAVPAARRPATRTLRNRWRTRAESPCRRAMMPVAEGYAARRRGRAGR